MILLPGNNELKLCPLAIKKILEHHINGSMYDDKDGHTVHVTHVYFKDDTLIAQVSTDHMPTTAQKS